MKDILKIHGYNVLFSYCYVYSCAFDVNVRITLHTILLPSNLPIHWIFYAIISKMVIPSDIKKEIKELRKTKEVTFYDICQNYVLGAFQIIMSKKPWLQRHPVIQ